MLPKKTDEVPTKSIAKANLKLGKDQIPGLFMLEWNKIYTCNKTLHVTNLTKIFKHICNGFIQFKYIIKPCLIWNSMP